MSTNTLTLQESDLDLLVKIVGEHVDRIYDRMHIPHAEIAKAEELLDQLRVALTRRDTGKEVGLPTTEELLVAQDKTA